MKKNVRVIIWGFGVMGKGMAKMLLDKKGVDIVGIVDRPKRAGKSMFELLGVEGNGKKDVITGPLEEVIYPEAADVVLLCTDSFVEPSFDKIKYICENKINVITTAEEMAYPMAQYPELSKKMDEIAKNNGVSILGTGINPGLVMDLLVLVLTGCMENVEHILARRVNSLSPFGKAVMQEQGIGISVEKFNELKSKGEMSGHVGFAESVQMIADGIGWKVDEFKQNMEPIVTDVDRVAPHGEAKAGSVAGVSMSAEAKVDGVNKIIMEHPQQIEPEQVGVNTGDYIVIEGNPPINMVNKPEMEGGVGTIAMCVNMIPQIINASPGLKTMLDLPVPRAIMGDFRDRIED